MLLLLLLLTWMSHLLLLLWRWFTWWVTHLLLLVLRRNSLKLSRMELSLLTTLKLSWMGKTNMDKTTTSELPTEILVKILSYVNQTDRHVGVARVCKLWRHIVHYYLSEEILVSFRATALNCDWKMVAENSWHSVKRLYLIGSVPNIYGIAWVVKDCCPNIAISYRWVHHVIPGDPYGITATNKTRMEPFVDTVRYGRWSTVDGQHWAVGQHWGGAI